ncbi:MAG: protein kinase [Deltaproteobacteria bacterium]|nr:protein kinase [Deltaproteobacteria bacterium]
MSPALAPGVLVEQRFELVTRMGDRGYGESWKALDRRFKNRVVMLKFLRPVPGVEASEDLNDHINSLRALKHNQVLAVVGHGLVQSTPFLVHEYFEGRSLGAGLDEARETGALLPLRLLEALFAKVAAAVSAAHQTTRPLIHGGLNPGCVVIHRLPGEELQVRVLDFRAAPLRRARPSAPARSARALLNLAPEQFEGATPTEATDVFGLGALLREMIFGPTGNGRHPRADCPSTAAVPTSPRRLGDRRSRPPERSLPALCDHRGLPRRGAAGLAAARRRRTRAEARSGRVHPGLRLAVGSPIALRHAAPRPAGSGRRALCGGVRFADARPHAPPAPFPSGRPCATDALAATRLRLSRCPLRSHARSWCSPSRTTPRRWCSPTCPPTATPGTSPSTPRSSPRRHLAPAP